MKDQHFDSMSVGMLDFKSGRLEKFSLVEGLQVESSPVFDLASLTKPLVLGTNWLKNQKKMPEDYITAY